MLTSLGLIILLGLMGSEIMKLIRLPGIIGMLLVGIVIGPYALNLLDDSILLISSDLRKMALIIILIKAGLSLNLNDLKKVGRPALMMSFVPASFEILAFIIFAPSLLEISRIEAALMGAVLGAVSPAVVVPRMVKLMEEGYGSDKSIPELILAGATCDDIYVIVLFTSFLGMLSGEGISVISFINIPISIILGIVLGLFTGYILYLIFEYQYSKNRIIRNSTKVIIILGISFMFITLENLLEAYIAISGLLATMSMAIMLKAKCTNKVIERLSNKFSRLWIFAEIILFVLVGSAVDIRYTLNAGTMAIVMIFIALVFRAIGVSLCLYRTKLNLKEKLFTVIAYIPKATVQAAIGSVPLAMGLRCGEIVLSIAVLAILITAPIGAIGIDMSYKKLLNK